MASPLLVGSPSPSLISGISLQVTAEQGEVSDAFLHLVEEEFKNQSLSPTPQHKILRQRYMKLAANLRQDYQTELGKLEAARPTNKFQVST